MRTVLAIAYLFPPAGGRGAAGSLRVTKFARYLPSCGWTPIVMTVHEEHYARNLTIDESLSGNSAQDLAVERTHVWHLLAPLLRLRARLRRWMGMRGGSTERSPGKGAEIEQKPGEMRSRHQRFKDGLTDLFEIPDEVSGWIVPGVSRGLSLIRSRNVDVIFATGRPWTSLVIGTILKRLTGRPLVTDFRDPWVTNPFRTQPSAFKDWAEHKLEGWVVRSADLIVANTDNLREEFVERFGNAVASRCITILNGFDADEFATVSATVGERQTARKFQLLHSGVCYGKRDPKSLIDALRLLIDRGEITEDEVQCDFVGDIKLRYDLLEYIRASALQHVVHLHGEVSYRESIEALARCDATILLQPGTTTQIPSKVFEYIGLGKQIIAIAPPDSAVSSLVAANGLGFAADPGDVASVATTIMESYRRWRDGVSIPALDPDVQARFEVRNGVAALSAAMERLADGLRDRRPPSGDKVDDGRIGSDGKPDDRPPCKEDLT
jgi:glycosyltransferase involved in cell wall biosynthesis